jgi:hypothetical protein
MRHRMKPLEQSLLAAYLDGTIDSSGMEALQEILRRDAETRRILRGMATVETKLAQLASGDHETLRFLGVSPGIDARHRPKSIAWRKIAAVTAGVVIALACTSIVFAFVPATFGGARIAVLLESFESGPAPGTNGWPIVPGVWGGDYSETVGSRKEISPAHGRRMFRFLRADYAGKAPQMGCSSEVARIVDLSEHESLIARGDALITVAASFASSAVGDAGRYRFEVSTQTVSVLPGSGGEVALSRILDAERNSPSAVPVADNPSSTYSPSSSYRSLVFPPDRVAWQRLRVSTPISSGTRYLLLRFVVTDMQAIEHRADSSDVAFPAQFLDDIRVTLSREPAQP